MLAARPRFAKAALALLAGLLVGGFLGGGAVWGMNRSKLKDPNTVHDVSLPKASELDLVPADGVAFAHVRLADMWRTDAMSEFRKVLEKAGPDAIKAFDEGFVPAPSTADRLTVFGFKSTDAPPPPPNVKGGFIPQPADATHICGILAFSAPFEEARVREANIPGAGESTANGKKFWSDPATDLAIHFHTDRVIVVGPSVAVKAFLSLKPAKEGPLANALALAASGGRPVVAAARTSPAPGPPPPARGRPQAGRGPPLSLQTRQHARQFRTGKRPARQNPGDMGLWAHRTDRGRIRQGLWHERTHLG